MAYACTTCTVHCTSITVFFIDTHVQSIQWSGWMDDMTTYAVDPSKPYADIIVPTLDTVRGSFMIELLLTNDKQVSPPTQLII